MALPKLIEILLQDQVKLIVEGAENWSRKQVDWNDTSTYRNTFPNHKVEVKPGNGSGVTLDTDTANVQVPGSPAAATVVNDWTTGDLATRVFVDDVVAAIEPHIWKKIAWRVEFWDGPIGREMTMTVGTTSNSATISVPDNSLLTPGQLIAGTNIPTGARILYVPYSTRTSVILSHKATNTGDVEATFDGSNWLAGYWEHESLGDAQSIKILM